MLAPVGSALLGLSVGQSMRRHLVRALLDNLLEVFPDTLDPVEDFEGYAVRRLSLALRRSLEHDTD